MILHYRFRLSVGVLAWAAKRAPACLLHDRSCLGEFTRGTVGEAVLPGCRRNGGMRCPGTATLGTTSGQVVVGSAQQQRRVVASGERCTAALEGGLRRGLVTRRLPRPMGGGEGAPTCRATPSRQRHLPH